MSAGGAAGVDGSRPATAGALGRLCEGGHDDRDQHHSLQSRPAAL